MLNSKRQTELMGTMWDAFAAGDKWVRFNSLTTASLTGVALVYRGLADFDEILPGKNYGRRIRLSDEYLADNGYEGRDWRLHNREMLEMLAEDGELDNPSDERVASLVAAIQSTLVAAAA